MGHKCSHKSGGKAKVNVTLHRNVPHERHLVGGDLLPCGCIFEIWLRCGCPRVAARGNVRHMGLVLLEADYHPTDNEPL
jgi:hypothetical protein